MSPWLFCGPLERQPVARLFSATAATFLVPPAPPKPDPLLMFFVSLPAHRVAPVRGSAGQLFYQVSPCGKVPCSLSLRGGGRKRPPRVVNPSVLLLPDCPVSFHRSSPEHPEAVDRTLLTLGGVPTKRSFGEGKLLRSVLKLSESRRRHNRSSVRGGSGPPGRREGGDFLVARARRYSPSRLWFSEAARGAKLLTPRLSFPTIFFWRLLFYSDPNG